ncbi:hypothetical protein CONLIGDRAFT_100322 [Coniochaeta ligniaria NRRL 30616]|uniref:Uncharacterized protein n=1 Tax=Coniochaeta ligniaria NRRL 30616 TaxID=1408157 RepID=A0A1J7JAI0_9PEZI|nr:hypothetical protein CONLIGDRAFT_100322 [Coniochaeta ligniaria NRRL 30616]
MSWAINDWDKQDNQWGEKGYVYMEPSTAPLDKQLLHAEGQVDTYRALVAKNQSQSKKGAFNTKWGKGLNGRDGPKYAYKLHIALDHVAALKKKMAPPPAPAAKPAAAAPAAKKPMDKDAILTKAFGTEKQQAASDRTDTQKEIFDKGVAGVQTGLEAKDLVKTLKGPLTKGGGLIEARDGGGFGEIQQIVKFALAKTPKDAYKVALDRREIYLLVNVINEAAAKIVDIETYFPVSGWRKTQLPEMGPFALRPIDPRNKQGSFSLLGGASSDGIFMKTLVYGRFIRAGISFCAETPDKKAHLDFSVGFNWEPGISIITNGTAGVSVIVGKNAKGAFEQAKKGLEAEVTSGGLRVFAAINGQQVVIGVGRV